MARRVRTRTVPGRLRDERGAALVIVLTIVALLTITVVEFTYSVQLDQHRARNALNALQAQLMARSGVNIAEAFLAHDYEPKFDAFTEDWALQLQEFCQGVPLAPGVLLKCDVEDESGKINVNLTRPPKAAQQPNQDEKRTKDSILRDALEYLANQYDIKIEELGDRVREYWEEVPATPAPGERTATARVSDFQSIEDFANTFQIPKSKLERLRRVLTAQPAQRLPAINANTAPPDVLRAVIIGYYGDGDDVVQRILDRRTEEEAFQDKTQVAEALADLDDTGGRRSAIGQILGVQSNLFRLQASAITNADPTGETTAGIGQTLSVLVRRSQLGAAQRGTGDQQQQINWTFRRLDWQKEPGARLFREPAEDEPEETEDEDGVMDDGRDTLGR